MEAYRQIKNELIFRYRIFACNTMKIRNQLAIWLFIVFACILIPVSSCKKNKDIPDAKETVTDADSNVYKTVKIGSQTWMVENLKTTRYKDGTKIQRDTDSYGWGVLTKPAYCWYKNDSAAYKSKYGAIYNGFAVQTNKLCPAGWHVPTQEDWRTLESHLGLSREQIDSISFRGTDEGSRMKYGAGWSNKIGSNSSGFTALPAGYRHTTIGMFIGAGLYTTFWSSTNVIMNSDTTDWIWIRQLEYEDPRIFCGWSFPGFGFSVRCLKDN